MLNKIAELPDEALAETPGLWRIVNLLMWHTIFFHRNVKQAAICEPTLTL
ncbi:MAG: hypothetical protein R2867_46115 [Caldilineaceae bacterium]